MREIPYDPQVADQTVNEVLSAGGQGREEWVREAVDRLPDEHRIVLEWKFWERIPDRALAERLGLASHGAAQYRVRRALEALRVELENEEEM